jgi:Methyltransferase FkbM domain
LINFTGANVGFFAVFAELEFDVPDALRIIAIEPCSKNFKLLQQNMKLYAPTAHLVQAAISSVPRMSKRTLNGADGNVGKHKRVSRSEWAPNQHGGGGNLRSSMRDREDQDEELTGAAGDITVEGAENKRGIFVKDEDEDEESEVADDEIAEGKKEEKEGDGEGEGVEHAFMTYYPRMPGNSRLTNSAGEGPSYFHSSFQSGSCQERVVVRTLSDVIDDYDRKYKNTDRYEDSDGNCDYCDDSVRYSGETRGGDTRGNIALLKVDVEGSELCVLQSLEPRHWNRIDQIVVETERPTGVAEGSVSGAQGSAGDIINCNAHSTKEKQTCRADDGDLHQQSNYYRIYNLLKLQGFRVVEEWGDPDGYDTGCLLLFGIKERR